ncbi:hypothetical protein [Bergeyella zoohelcum]|uniref:Lipoprotein n=2 Tax=Bergeyella zoohelcum TaxID=1015 RepID=K1LPM1_9FLAO|nr:hypothetical protein [Bergeyella zoohelcum]EKB58915.1 hypothetical protein HMPREF9699_00460 [Bergeyella zoohelcum ATCC 43767]EKB60817.1 hypothetical protein HMPREF9700_00312 [Bergeyella zoohelcum CCUG 30536]SSZ47091.1 Uncharacterised protein [Bergeyella zoohelcum]SUV49351.1 Uncharacterised protein [Bergeyella zoohelcum]VDH03471.1 Uncharacterised protein [Bergeyella zoohelcum]
MKTKYTIFSGFLSVALALSSCSVTTKYTATPNQPKNFSQLNSGKRYKFTLENNEKHRMTFSHLTHDSIVGYSTRGKKEQILLAKSDVKSSKDLRKSGVRTAGIGIGIAGVAAIIYSATRATKDEKK